MRAIGAIVVVVTVILWLVLVVTIATPPLDTDHPQVTRTVPDGFPTIPASSRANP